MLSTYLNHENVVGLNSRRTVLSRIPRRSHFKSGRPSSSWPASAWCSVQSSMAMLSTLLCLPLRPRATTLALVRHKSKVSKSSVPVLAPEQLEEKFTLGSGPGGQAVNRTANAVFLKHLPTGLWVKCHQTRSIESNRKIARKLLTTKLDNHINGENSVENQQKVLDKLNFDRKKEKTRLKYEKKRLEKLTINSKDSETEDNDKSVGVDSDNDLVEK